MLSIPGLENVPALRFVIAFAIIFILLALFALILRRLKGSRLTLASDRGRARQPRLGIVDVYDLDRQRQLILLRRDNVEHLLLVGGPNDVVVETSIVRMPGTRLPPSPTDAVEIGPERNGETSSRPVIEAAPARPADLATPAQPGEPSGAAPGRGPAAPRAAVAPTRPAPAATASGDPRAERPRANPMPPAAAPPPAARPPAGKGPTAAPAAPVPQRNSGVLEPQRDASPGDRAVLSGMARELEDVLKRPPERSKTGRNEPVRLPAAPLPSRLEGAVGAPAGPNRGRPDLGAQRRPESEPTPSPAAASPDPAEPSRPADVVATPPPDASSADHKAVEAPGSSAGPLPNGAAPVQAAPESSPPAAERPSLVEAPPEPAPRSDPFSIEDIEAEFARLLGRPLERKDKT